MYRWMLARVEQEWAAIASEESMHQLALARTVLLCGMGLLVAYYVFVIVVQALTQGGSTWWLIAIALPVAGATAVVGFVQLGRAYVTLGAEHGLSWVGQS